MLLPLFGSCRLFWMNPPFYTCTRFSSNDNLIESPGILPSGKMVHCPPLSLNIAHFRNTHSLPASLCTLSLAYISHFLFHHNIGFPEFLLPMGRYLTHSLTPTWDTGMVRNRHLFCYTHMLTHISRGVVEQKQQQLFDTIP